jgi:hypothetical protein
MQGIDDFAAIFLRRRHNDLAIVGIALDEGIPSEAIIDGLVWLRS